MSIYLNLTSASSQGFPNNLIKFFLYFNNIINKLLITVAESNKGEDKTY